MPRYKLTIEYDGTGVPMTKNEVAGRKGKQKDGTAKTREAKLGCVFTQTRFDEDGRPIRDPASTTFTGAIEYNFLNHHWLRICIRQGLFSFVQYRGGGFHAQEHWAKCGGLQLCNM